MVEICTLFLLTIFDVILMGKSSTSFLVSCKLMKTFGEVFSCVCNFKQVIFARLLSLKFSSKSPWCTPVPLKFQSYNLHHCKKSCCKLVFLVFTEQLLYQIIFGRLHCYEVTLVKKCIYVVYIILPKKKKKKKLLYTHSILILTSADLN